MSKTAWPAGPGSAVSGLPPGAVSRGVSSNGPAFPFFSFSPGCSGIAWNSWSPWDEGTQSESLLSHLSSQSPSPSPKGPWCVLLWRQLQQPQGTERRRPRELPSVGRKPRQRDCRELAPAAVQSSSETGGGHGGLLRLLLGSGWASGWPAPSTESHLGPPFYLRVSVVWMVPREMLVLLVPR